MAEAFGRQTRDGIWMIVHSDWDTPEGLRRGASHLATRWREVTRDREGNLNTIFLKATVADPGDPAKRVLAGMAIWEQCSIVEGWGNPVSVDTDKDFGMAEHYPDNELERRFVSQAMTSFYKPRQDLANVIASSSRPALFALDLCAVSPAFQRRGIAGKLTKWGLKEAERRGGLEAVLEASAMGRPVYERLGFKVEGTEIPYNVDKEFAGRDMPASVFMRTGL